MIRKSVVLLLLFASIVGAVAATLSWYEHTMLEAGLASGESMCNISASFNCDAVNKSQYSKVFGLPLAAFGLAFYLSMLFGSLYAVSQKTGRVFWGSVTVIGFGAVALSAYLFYISKTVIGAFCLFCMVMYAVNIIIFIVGVLGSRCFHFAGCIWSSLDAPWQFLRSLLLGQPTGSRVFAIAVLISIASILGGSRSIEELLLKTVHPESEPANPSKDVNNAALQMWKSEPVTSIPVTPPGTGALTTDYSLGSPDAPIHLIEFSDFECSACRMKFGSVEALLEKYAGKIFFVHKNFPLDQACNRGVDHPMHHHSCFASRFTRCVGEQGKFWDGYKYVFSEPIFDEEDVTRPRLTAAFFTWAKSQGLDIDALSSCMNDERSLTKIKEDIDLSLIIPIEQTPTFFLNGKKISFDRLEPVLGSLAQ